MLIFSFLSTLLKYVVVDALWAFPNQVRQALKICATATTHLQVPPHSPTVRPYTYVTSLIYIKILIPFACI